MHDGRIVTIVFCLLTFVVASGFLVTDGRCKTISGKGDLSVASLPGEKRSGLLGLLGIGALKRLPAVVES